MARAALADRVVNVATGLGISLSRSPTFHRRFGVALAEVVTHAEKLLAEQELKNGKLGNDVRNV
jgi:hypothetical protein